MSFTGRNPTNKWMTFEPQNADPSSPNEGDIFYSDGTPRTEGLWVYINAAWAQVSTSVASSVFTSITLTPQSSDPGSPTTGMIFYSNGTPRAVGHWIYNGSGWVQLSGVQYQEFQFGEVFVVRAASTINVTLANQVENGDSFGGVTLVTGDFVLLKNQTTSSENGVYVVQASGAPTRHSLYDTAAELTKYQAVVFVTSGTNARTRYFQTEVLTTLSDNQTWSTSAPSFSATVPAGKYEMEIFGVGGGGGGGGGSNGGVSGGGGGGGGAQYGLHRFKVTPGDTLTINLGVGGIGGAANTDGAAGTSTTISGTGVYASFVGGGYGGGFTGTTANNGGASFFRAGGVGGGANGGGGGGASGMPYYTTTGAGGAVSGAAGSDGIYGTGGGGGAGSPSSFGGNGGAGGISEYVATGAAGGTAGGGGGGDGGGGGSSYGIGGIGGDGNNTPSDGTSATTSTGAGGGGGGGSGDAGNGALGGNGGSGYMRVSWI